MIGAIILGLLAGYIAKALMPGDDPGGFFVTPGKTSPSSCSFASISIFCSFPCPHGTLPGTPRSMALWALLR